MPTPRSRLLVALLLLALGLAFHALLAGMDRPFGVHDVNPGCFFGVWARNWDRFGFGALRGLPLGSQLLDAVHQGDPDTNHPPLYPWLCYACGLTEAQLRLPTVIGHALSTALMFLLLAPALGGGAAFVGGLAILAMPALGFWSQASFECAVLPVSLALWIACLRWRDSTGASRSRWAALVFALAFVNLWLDWLAAFLTFAVLPLLWGRPLVAAARRLAVPFGAAVLAAASIAAWSAWARSVPDVAHAQRGEGLANLIGRTFVQRPALGVFLAQVYERLRAGFTLPLLIAGGAGLVPLALRQPRLAAAAVLAAAVIPLVFAQHSTGHVQFVAYFAVPLAMALAALASLHRIALCASLALVVWVGHVSLDQIAQADTPFFKVLGRTLSRAARTREAGRTPLLNFVFFNAPYWYGYYVDAGYFRGEPAVPMNPLLDPKPLELADQLQGPGLRYLYLRTEGSLLRQLPGFAPNAALEEYLARFPRARVPELELQLLVPPDGETLRITEAWLYTLVP